MNSNFKLWYKLLGFGYVLAWVVGLSAGGPSLPLNASGADIQAAFLAHKISAAVQFTLTEGLAGLLLILLVILIMRTQYDTFKNTRLFSYSGIAAGIFSIVMWMLGMLLILSVAPHGTPQQSEQVFNSINRLDGPKMWLLGLMAIGSINAFLFSKPVRIIGSMLAAALFVSGISYGLLLQNLAWSAYVSGILLLVWVGGLGWFIKAPAQ